MQKILTILFIVTLSLAATAAVYGQFPISIPKIPKIRKDRPSSSNTNSSDDSSSDGEQYTYEQNQALNRIVNDPDHPKKWLVLPYMECFDKRHNFQHNQYKYGQERRFKSNKEKVDTLTREQADLAQLERDLRANGISERIRISSDGMDDLRNPAIWLEIASRRQEYLQCVVADVPKAGECGKLDDIAKTRVDTYKEDLDALLKEAKSFNGDRGWYSSRYREDWLLAAISPSKRQKLATEYGDLYPCISGLLDEIQAAAKQTLPKYTLYSYNVRNPAAERVLRSAISDLNLAKVFKIGLLESSWLMEKNSIGIPVNRFKHGAIWVKYPSVDHGYCQILWINIVQEYAGGGTWGSPYGNFVRNEPAGCPTK